MRQLSNKAKRRGWIMLLINLVTLMLILAIVIIAVCAAGEAAGAVLGRLM